MELTVVLSRAFIFKQLNNKCSCCHPTLGTHLCWKCVEVENWQEEKKVENPKYKKLQHYSKNKFNAVLRKVGISLFLRSKSPFSPFFFLG